MLYEAACSQRLPEKVFQLVVEHLHVTRVRRSRCEHA